MEDIPDILLYVFIFILVVILILFILKYRYNWVFKIYKKDNLSEEKNKIINEVVKNVDQKIESFEEVKRKKDKEQKEPIKEEEQIKEEQKEPIKEEQKEEQKEIKQEENKQTESLEDTINKLVEEKINEKLKNNELIERNNGELLVKRKYNTYNVMINEPKGILDQSKLMIDQIVNKNLERYYAYVKPVVLKEEPFNDKTFCLKCNTKDNEYSSYFSENPLEYSNDNIEGGENKEIKAYNI